jgi:hypothetical protein
MKGGNCMNIDTGELRAIADAMELDELKKEWGDSLREVPPDMLEEVKKIHDGKIDLDSDSPLANFAREEREQRDKGVRALLTLGAVAATIATMNETAQARREQRVVASKRKSAFPEKKSKRKMVQSSRKRNR